MIDNFSRCCNEISLISCPFRYHKISW